MLVYAEEFPVFRKCKYIAVRIDSGFIELIKADKSISHFVRGIAEHKHNFLCALGDSPEADCESVTGNNREYDTDSLTAQLSLYIRCYVIYRNVVTLGSCND